MAEIATLGFAVDSSGLDKGTASLNRLSVAANQVEASANKAASAVSKTGQSVQQSNTKAASASQQLARHLEQTARAAERFGSAGSAANDNLVRLERTVQASAGAFRTLISVMGPLAALFSVSTLSQMTDKYTSLTNTLRVVAGAQGDVNGLLDSLNNIATRTRTPLEAVVTLYQRTSIAARELGASQQDILRFTENVGLALAQQGGSAAQASGALMQLSQSLGAGTVRAEEFNSILEGAYPLAMAAARGLDAAGGSVGKLRKLVLDGKVSSEAFFNAILSQSDDLEKTFGSTVVTIGQAFQTLSDNLVLTIGKMDAGAGASSTLAKAILVIANNLDRLITYAATAATAFGTYLVAGFVAANAAAITLSGSLAFLRGALIRTGIGALVVAAGELVYQFTDLVSKTGGLSAAMETLGKRAVIALDAVKFAFMGASEAIRSIWFQMLADVVQATEQAFGPLLRTFGVSAESMQASIAGLAKGSKEWADVSKSSFEIAGEQFATAFAPIKAVEGATDDLAETAVKAAAAEDELTKAQKRAADQAADRARQRQEAINQLELDIQLVGKSAAETARLTAEYQFMAEARRDAKGGIIDPAEIAQIKEAADEIGKLTQALALKNAQEELSFERSLLGLPDPEKRIRQDLRGKGIDYASPEGEDLAAQMRYLDNAHKIEDQLKEVHDAGKDAFMDILDALGDGENAIDAMISGLAGLGRAFAKIGQERLFDALSGKGGGIGSFASGFPAAPRIAANDNTDPWEGMRSLSKSLEGTSKSALDVARGFDGLNERADSKVLDGFLRASGNWKGMSAQDTAWCAAFANASIMSTGGQGTGSNLASSFLNWGNATNAPKPGDIVVLKPQSRGASGHVGFVAGFGDGTVQVFGGNQSNGANTKSFGMDQVAGFRTGGDVRVLAKGVEDGTIAASNKLGIAPVAAGAGGQQGGFFQNGGMDVLGAGAGAFAQGFQSGSPFGGGISGVMSGYGAGPAVSSALGVSGSMGGILGAVGGGLLGVIGGIFGKKSQEKAERKAAQKELEKQMGAIEEMLDYASGTITGGIGKAVREFKDETAKAIELATKAGDKALAKRLKASVGELEARLIKDFADAYEGTIEGLNKGLGLDNPFKQGFDAVKALRDELLAFVDDAKTAGLAFDAASDSVLSATGKAGSAANSNNLNEYQARDLINRHQRGEDISQYSNATWGLSPFSGDKDNGGPNSVYMEQLFAAREAARAQALAKAKDAAEGAAEAERQLSDARKAAVNQALSVLSGGTELTEIEQQMMELRGKVAALAPVLKDLGLGADEATRAIESHLAIAVAKLKDQYIEDVTRSINDLSGLGFMNDIIDAQETYQARLKDAAAVGMDGSLALTELNLSIADIARSADLTDDQLKMLAKAFPALAGSFLGALNTETVGQAQEAVERARADLRAAYEKEASALEQVIDRTKDFIKSTTALRNSLKVDNNLSPLSGYDRFLEAQKQFRDVSEKAMGGDEDAMAQLEGVSREYLDEARSYYASSEDYFRAFNEVQGILDKSLSSAEQQLAKDEEKLKLLKDQVSKLIDIDNSVNTVASAIGALSTAMASLGAAMAASAAQAAKASNEDIARAYNDTLGRAPDAPGQAYWENSGKTGDQIRSDIANSPEALNKAYKDILGRNVDAASAAYWASTGKSVDQIKMDLEWAKAHGSYASGGYTGDMGRNDIAGVVHGQEFVMNAAATAKWRPQFEAMNAGRAPADGGDNSAVVAELRAVRAELAEIKAGQRQHITVTAQGAVAVKDAVETGNGAQQTLANNTKRRSAA